MHYVKIKVRVLRYPDGDLAVFHGPRLLARFAADGQPFAEQMKEAAQPSNATKPAGSGGVGHSR